MEKGTDTSRGSKAGSKPDFVHSVFISEEIKQAASEKCERNISCLSREREDLCKVISCIDSTHFVLCQHEDRCNFQSKIRERTLCDCPVRIELYRKHKI